MRCSQGILNSAVRPCLQVLACRCLPKGRALGAQLKAALVLGTFDASNTQPFRHHRRHHTLQQNCRATGQEELWGHCVDIWNASGAAHQVSASLDACWQPDKELRSDQAPSLVFQNAL